MKHLSLLIIGCYFSVLQAQTIGYQWSFGSSPFNSAPAVSGSNGNYPLTTIGSGSIVPGVSENVGLGTSCTSNINTGTFTKPFGLLFSNSPQFVNNSYTIAMVFKFSDLSSFKRVLNFENHTNQSIDRGVYFNNGALNFYEGFNAGTTVTGTIFFTNTYFHLTLVRNGSTKLITCYKNGVQVATFSDINDNFIPKASALFAISFFKDNVDNNEESSGSVAKIYVYNFMMNSTQVQQNFNNICNNNVIILPVSLSSFTAQKNGMKSLLNWTTASEQNNKGFEIQRSTDGMNYDNIGWVASMGNSSSLQHYSFTDMAPAKGKNFYRLNQVDIDGKNKLSAIRKIDFTRPFDITVYPNPAMDVLNVQVNKNITEIKILNTNGKQVWQQQNAGELFITIPVQTLTSGIYLLEFTDCDGNRDIQKFLKASH